MGLPLAENGIFPSLTAPEVGVTPNKMRLILLHLFPGSATAPTCNISLTNCVLAYDVLVLNFSSNVKTLNEF